MKEELREQSKGLAKHDEPTVLDPNGPITIELNGEPWKQGTVQEIADYFNIDLTLFNTLTRDALQSTLQGLSVAGKIEIKLSVKYQ